MDAYVLPFTMFVICHAIWFTDVSVETIASFNKMKSITSDIKMVVQAMKNSSLLEVWKTSFNTSAIYTQFFASGGL